jgi:superfamily II DNA helicase RecQ
VCDNASAREQLNQFLATHRIVAVEKQWVAEGMASFWAICVTFLEGAGGNVVPQQALRKETRIDYRDVLNEVEFALFAKLRTLRKTLAEKEGVPAYALFTNEQLAAMVQRKVANKSGLGEISGVGSARIEKYGAAFLEVMNSDQ